MGGEDIHESDGKDELGLFFSFFVSLLSLCFPGYVSPVHSLIT